MNTNFLKLKFIDLYLLENSQRCPVFIPFINSNISVSHYYTDCKSNVCFCWKKYFFYFILFVYILRLLRGNQSCLLYHDIKLVKTKVFQSAVFFLFLWTHVLYQSSQLNTASTVLL